MTLKVYVDYISQPARAIMVFILMNNIPHEVVIIKVFEGQHLTAEFKKINPMGKIPAIDDDGFFLFESHAILRYLAVKYKVPDHWYSKDPKKMAIVDRYLDWHHAYLRNGCMNTVFFTVFAEKLKIPITVDLEEKKQLMIFSLNMVDRYFLKDNKFIGGDKISIADLSAVCEISQILFLRVDLTGFKNLTRWFRTVMEIPEVAKVHQVFYNLLKNYNPQPKF